jgi:hypothetical protein
VTDELCGGGKLWYCRILEFVTEYGMPSELQVGSSNERVPPLRIAIGEANRNAPVWMTELFVRLVTQAFAPVGMTESDLGSMTQSQSYAGSDALIDASDENSAPGLPFWDRDLHHCLIRGFATEYRTSVRKFTAT